MAERTEGVAALLRDAGLRHEERALIVLPDLPPFAWTFFGC